MRIGQEDHIGPQISLNLVSVKTLISFRWTMWSFTSNLRSRLLVGFVWLRVLIENMARWVLSAFLMSPPRFPLALLVKRDR